MSRPFSPLPERPRFNLSRWAIQHPRLIVGFWLAVMTAGLLAFSSLKYALFPDITFPVVVVSVSVPAAAADSPASGLPSSGELPVGISLPGGALPLSAATVEADVVVPLERQLSQLQGAGEIQSTSYPGQAVISLPFDVGTDLANATQRVEAALKQVSLPTGAITKVTPINLNETAPLSYVLEGEDVAQLAQLARDQLVPALEKVPGVLQVPILGSPDSSNRIRFNGEAALGLRVVKRGDANTLDVVGRVEREIEQLRGSLKPPTRLILAANQADYIHAAIESTLHDLGFTLILAVVVIYPFLRNWRATLISALAIPTSLLATFIVMASFGFNLETITLLAIALVIGVVVDDAIVDVENIMRHIEAGESPYEAAVDATSEIGWAVTAATLTIVAVFLPVALMGNVIGQFFKPFGITVSAAVLASLLVARTLSPVVAAHWLKPSNRPQRSNSEEGQFWTTLVEQYYRLLRWGLSHRWLVVGCALATFVLGLALIPLVPKGFIPRLDRGEFNVVYSAPPSVQLSDSVTIAERIETSLKRFPDIQTVFTTVGSREGQSNRGSLYVKLVPPEQRQISTFHLQEQVRDNLPQLADVNISVEDPQVVDLGGEKPLKAVLLGNEIKALQDASSRLQERLGQLRGLEDVTATPLGEFQIDRQDQQRAVVVTANLARNTSLGDATAEVVAAAKDLNLPPSIRLDLGGDSGRLNEVFSSFSTTLSLSVLCILVVLVVLLRSWTDPLVILLSLPLSLTGSVVALLVTGREFGMISLIGVIFLMGLVDKNAILLVDYINQLRQQGFKRTEAILKAGPVRLRPILMTTVSTLLGMVPVALGLGAGAETRAPMAIAIIGGLTASTLLSLVVIPVAYALLDDLAGGKRKQSLPSP
ncbi:efflux RND transporter permease subunit [Leptolyngbya sp. FACHB-261]|uniref:efflux RND transporter permease subunit n=1 Tax=Leptolyngbya sp. FACHB-261 TaxID=2692806 RepID=UPI00168278FF|nr:efflux RND transporter permease subunit [Leptolyngbya sp. FACHB-261]MBD2104904.1 efflux RND transporter permease subunit [Leptolyngbya sp. FACHB-261]